MIIKVFTSFSGYDSQCLALKYLGLSYDLVGWSEIDKYAIQSHNLLFPEYKARNYGDISKIDWTTVPDFNLFTYSFPCTDISIAGKQQGFSENSNTRSSLLWECRKAIKTKRPKYLLMENVKALTGKKNLPLFRKWLTELSNIGYTNYTQVLNAKDYGIPQNRERVFTVSVLGEGYYFPDKTKLTKSLRDIMEDDVKEKYYLSDKLVKYFIEKTKKNNKGFVSKPKTPNNIAGTILAHGTTGTTDNYLIVNHCEQLGNIVDDSDKNFKNPQRGRIYSVRGIAPTQVTVGNSIRPSYLINNKIRKLTPKESLRLMGVREEDIDILLNSGISDTQLYKLAGNSIVVDVLMAIFNKMFINKTKHGEQLVLI